VHCTHVGGDEAERLAEERQPRVARRETCRAAPGRPRREKPPQQHRSEKGGCKGTRGQEQRRRRCPLASMGRGVAARGAPCLVEIAEKKPSCLLGDGRVLRCVNGLGGGQGWHAEQADGVR
jgi:hypothetical protein